MNDYDGLCDVLKAKHVENIPGCELGSEYLEFGGDNMFYEGVVAVVAAIRIILETKGEVLSTAKYRGCDLVASQRGMTVVRAMRKSLSGYEWANANYKLSPYIHVFFECRKEFRYEIRSSCLNVDGVESLRQMNVYVRGVYKSITSRVFKTAERARARASNKLCVSFTSYIDDLLAVYARLVVVRVDLSYKRSQSELDSFGCVHDETNKQESANQLFKHRDQLLKRLSKSSSPYAMVGYAWKLEYGKKRGFHYHLMLFLDGSKVRQHITIGKAVGDMWVNEVTEGAGHYWNCTGNIFYYKTCGVGEVDHYDANKILAVKDAAAYLVKIDRWIAALLPGGMRCFGKGVVKSITSKKLGRPRVKGIQAEPCT
ncbi:YagK/YfjJ domain-containing protein [Pseudomonas mohnii]